MPEKFNTESKESEMKAPQIPLEEELLSEKDSDKDNEEQESRPKVSEAQQRISAPIPTTQIQAKKPEATIEAQNESQQPPLVREDGEHSARFVLRVRQDRLELRPAKCSLY